MHICLLQHSYEPGPLLDNTSPLSKLHSGTIQTYSVTDILTASSIKTTPRYWREQYSTHTPQRCLASTVHRHLTTDRNGRGTGTARL